MAVEALREAIKRDRGRAISVVHGGVTFEVREPSVGDFAQYAERLGGIDGKVPGAIEINREVALLSVRCVYDPDSGQRVFADDQVQLFLEGREIARKLINAVHELSKRLAAEGKVGSDETPSSASGSSSESSSG